MDNILNAVVGALAVSLGYWLAKEKTPKKTKLHLYCADIALKKITDTQFQCEPCNNDASVIIGGRTLCDDHYDIYLLEMSGTLEE